MHYRNLSGVDVRNRNQSYSEDFAVNLACSRKDESAKTDDYNLRAFLYGVPEYDYMIIELANRRPLATEFASDSSN